jgi:peptidoglycan/xylan/chitin deacetylase (PgdA/CDA1 family)
VRRMGQWLWVTLLRMGGGLWWAKRQLRGKGAVVVLMFHRVLHEEDWRGTHSLATIAVRERTFARLAAYIARRAEAVGLEEARPGVAGRKVRLALTFDDGWCDNYSTALPIVRKHGLPIAVFVCPGLAGRVAPFWPERAVAVLRAARPGIGQTDLNTIVEHLKRFSPEERARMLEELTGGAEEAEPYRGDRTLTWEAIAAMSGAGVTFGSHTHTHQILPALPAGAVRRELRESRDTIERELGKRCDLFAYPNGNSDEETARILAEEGFRLGFTTRRGAWTAECDPLRIPRANVCERNVVGLTGRFSAAMFEYTTYWKTWRAMRGEARPQIRPRGRTERAAA